MGRQYVHLSIDGDTAAAVGRRKSPNPIVLLVRAKGAWQTGLPFYIGNEKVWLADRVARQFIDFARAA
jgi:putative RNA 2'-phosphotransferase